MASLMNYVAKKVSILNWTERLGIFEYIAIAKYIFFYYACK